MTTTTPSSSSFPIRFGMWTNNLRFCLHLNQWGSVIWVWSEKHGWVLIEGSICFSSHIWRSLMNYKIEWLFRNTSSIGMIEWEISIKTLGQTKKKKNRWNRNDFHEDLHDMYVRVHVWRVSMVQVRVNLCTMNEWMAWREGERERKISSSRSLLSPILEHVSLESMCVSVSIRQFRRSHFLSVN